MTGLYRCFDAAFPPEVAPPGCAAVLGYIGGGRATHVWTLAEWERFALLVQFPAYVPDLAGPDTPETLAGRACAEAEALGWAPFQADRRIIVADLETAVVPTWFQRYAAETEQRGFTAVAYGSESTIAANFAADNWVAAWDGSAQLLPGQTIHAHQYADDIMTPGGTRVDYSVVDDWLLARGGRGPRHA